jgi:hypothetical protein
MQAWIRAVAVNPVKPVVKSILSTFVTLEHVREVNVQLRPVLQKIELRRSTKLERSLGSFCYVLIFFTFFADELA